MWHVTPLSPPLARDTLYVYLVVTDAVNEADDSALVFFDTNHDLTLGAEDRGVWFSRGGLAYSVNDARTMHLASLFDAATNCANGTRVCIKELAIPNTGWKIEAKLLPSDFGMKTFAGRVGAFVEVYNKNSNSVSLWPSNLVVSQPSSWVPLKLGTPNYRFCFRDVVNTPDTYMTPPVIDGTVVGDNGWTSAWRYVFNNGTTSPDVVVQGIKDATNIYLSFEVANDGDFNSADLISIAFDPTNAANDEWHLGIKPLDANGVSATIHKEQWTGAYTGAVNNAPGVAVAATTAVQGTNHLWSVEVAIPWANVGLSASQDFGFYFNVFPTSAPTTGPFGITGEFPWPTEMNAEMTSDEHVYPDFANWGTGTLGAVSCNGVYVDPTDIATNNVPPSKIALNTPNTFLATAHNSSVAGNGSSMAASNITATFKIANFGLPNTWSVVRADIGTPNPTAATTIPANSDAVFTFNWTLTGPEQNLYNTPTTEHQCILVELNSSGPPATMTTFANKSAWTNMDFGIASQFTSEAVVDGRGYGPPPKGQTAHVFQLTTGRSETTYAKPSGDSSTAADHGWKPFSQITYLVHGCRLSGRQILIGRDRYNICERVGSFGYVIRHEGTNTPPWRVKLRAAGLSRLHEEDGTVLRLAVPEGTEVPLHVVIQAEDRSLWGLISRVEWWVWIVLIVLLLLFGLKWAKATR